MRALAELVIGIGVAMGILGALLMALSKAAEAFEQARYRVWERKYGYELRDLYGWKEQ